ncbi:nucleoside diphosphate kinase 6 [Copidosoma floridanum]|uniref:nucleoside diphosphate kinase 6 n=1 Tax=Copidosoma floridanum TaxID=29053 RepID=UPI0006C97848|nr:nucleoside diphosphate kinase 6 [Copidosoma floridanum]
MVSSNPFQLTLAILKPHIIKSPIALQKIREIILVNEFKVVKTRRLTISNEEAEDFYREHKGKFFYNRLLTFMCSGPSDVHILASSNAVIKWRQLLGPTKVYQAQFTAPDTIRGMFGLSDTRNAAHGSDSEESAVREIGVFFKDFNIENWYHNDRVFFQTGKLIFDPELFVHSVNKSHV